MEVNDSPLAFADVSPGERCDPSRAPEAFVAFAKNPATYPGGSVLGDQLLAEISVWGARDSWSEPSDPDPGTVDVLLSRDMPAHSADGDYEARWAAGLLLRFSKDAAGELPESFHLVVEINVDLSDYAEPPTGPTTAEEFADHLRSALPQLFVLRADAVVVDRLQQVD